MVVRKLSKMDIDFYVRGDGIAARAITIGRQDTATDTLTFDMPASSVVGPLFEVTVDTIADLPASPPDGSFVRTLRYSTGHTAGDGSGNIYKYIDADATAADGGFVLTSAGGRWHALDKTIANLAQFGGYPDGTNATATTAALVAAVATTKDVYIPPGDFRINNEISLTNEGQTVFGTGWLSKITQETAEKNIFVISSGGDGVIIEKVHGIGEGTAPIALTQCNFVYANTCSNITVRHCIAEQYSNSGVQLRTTKNAKIESNLFFGSQNTNSSSADILCYGGNKRFAILGNRCFSDISQNIYVGPIVGDIGGIVSGNTCSTLDSNFDPVTTPTLKRHGIIASYGSNVDPLDLVISNNNISNTLWSGIYIIGIAEALVVSNNVIYEVCKNATTSLGGGIYIGGLISGVISGNVIQDITAVTTSGMGGISVKAATSAIITGNTIRSLNIAGIYITNNTETINIYDNDISDVALMGIGAAGNAALKANIKNNNIRVNGDLPGINLDAGSDDVTSVVIGNTIENEAATSGLCVTDDGGSLVDKTTDFNDFGTGDVLPLPWTPVVNDACYFGLVNDTFLGMILTASTQGVGTWTITWEYWNGSIWAALPGVADGTTGFTAAIGQQVVTWTTPSGWATTAVNGTTAYWIRARVSAYTSMTVQPALTIGYLFPGSVATNRGIDIRFHNYILRDNFVRGFAAGFYSAIGWSGRTGEASDNVVMNGQVFENCREGYVLRGNNSSSLIMVSDTKNINVGIPFGANGFFVHGREGRVTSGRLEYSSTSIPTVGTFAVGDLVWKSNIAAGGKIGWVCTTAGGVGVFVLKPWGAVDA